MQCNHLAVLVLTISILHIPNINAIETSTPEAIAQNDIGRNSIDSNEDILIFANVVSLIQIGLSSLFFSFSFNWSISRFIAMVIGILKLFIQMIHTKMKWTGQVDTDSWQTYDFSKFNRWKRANVTFCFFLINRPEKGDNLNWANIFASDTISWLEQNIHRMKCTPNQRTLIEHWWVR